MVNFLLDVSAKVRCTLVTVPYAVVVRLEDTTQTAQVYAEVQNIITQLEIQTRTRV